MKSTEELYLDYEYERDAFIMRGKSSADQIQRRRDYPDFGQWLIEYRLKQQLILLDDIARIALRESQLTPSTRQPMSLTPWRNLKTS